MGTPSKNIRLISLENIHSNKRKDSYKRMNNWIKRVVAFTMVVTQFFAIPAVSADSLENIQNKKEEVQAEVSQLQNNVESKLEEASELSIALNTLNNEIAEHEASIIETEEEIAQQEIAVEERYAYTAEQLKAMQTNEVNRNIVLSLFNAESITDLFNTLYAVVRLTGASEEHLQEAQVEHEILNELKEDLLVYKNELNEKQAKTVKQQEALEASLADLRKSLADNESVLANLSAEEQAIRAEQAAAQAARQQQTTVAATSTKTQSTASTSSSQASAATSSSSSSSSASSSNVGSWMTFQATGYSTQQPGLSTHTALGINLLQNPRVIAVDPNQIPLGSLVEVQGMGVYIAGDTGGAIKGRIIDIHFTTVRQALNWGRRNVNIRVIN